MHDDIGMHVIDPEIVLAFRTIAHTAQMGRGAALGFDHRKLALFRQIGIITNGAPCGLGQGMDHFPFAIHQLRLHAGQDEPEKGPDKKHNRQQDRREDLQQGGRDLLVV
jgi:hypothetical protein